MEMEYIQLALIVDPYLRIGSSVVRFPLAVRAACWELAAIRGDNQVRVDVKTQTTLSCFVTRKWTLPGTIRDTLAGGGRQSGKVRDRSILIDDEPRLIRHGLILVGHEPSLIRDGPSLVRHRLILVHDQLILVGHGLILIRDEPMLICDRLDPVDDGLTLVRHGLILVGG
jgi:hypothetical protein